MRQKRTKARIHEIKDGSAIITEEENIRSSAANFFHSLLTGDEGDLEEPNLDLIKPLPPEVDMELLCCNTHGSEESCF